MTLHLQEVSIHPIRQITDGNIRTGGLPASVISMIRMPNLDPSAHQRRIKNDGLYKPSRIPEETASLSGSSTLLAGYVLVSMAMHDAYPSINRQLTPESTFQVPGQNQSDRTSSNLDVRHMGLRKCRRILRHIFFVTPINESSSFSIASSFTKPSIK